MKSNGLLVFAILILILSIGISQANEHRDLWITSWSSGFESPSATTNMINWAAASNLNVIIPEIRLRADAYYQSYIEPPGTGVTMAPGYDPLADMVQKAHAQGIEVHPWVVTYRVWTTTSGPPSDLNPPHIWYIHPEWFMEDNNGNIFHGGVSNLDPGHPDVEDYLTTVFLDIIERYDVDGFSFDYIRYPGTAWGYNPVTVARFNTEYGRTGKPSTSDPDWLEFRRDQISNLVKRVYLESKAIKWHVRIGAAVWNRASTGYTSYLQDWDKWLKEGYLDYASPMMYSCNLSTFESFLNDARHREYNRRIYPIIDANCHNVIDQIYMVRNKGFQGMGLYSWQSKASGIQPLLVNGPFPTYAAPTDMPWLSNPTKGHLKGFVKDVHGNAIYPVHASVVGTSKTTKNTGTGFYGFIDLDPGAYTIKVEALGYHTIQDTVTITAGEVADLDFTMQMETNPPVISNVSVQNIQATNALVTWNTDKVSTSQVDYGLTSSYGFTTPEDMALVTSHSVQLVNLTPNTTYHFRVRSYDAVRNMAQSSNFTFTTAGIDMPDDIIVDNLDPEFSTEGHWWVGTYSGMWGSNYHWTSTAAGDRRATFRPNILTAGPYDVYIWYVAGDNRSTISKWRISYNGGNFYTTVDQTINGSQWLKIASDIPFAAGNTGFVRLQSDTGDSESKVIIADAVKLVFTGEMGDTEPPTAPTNLTAEALSPNQIKLDWTASTDNVGVAGYKIYRNGIEDGDSPTNSYIDNLPAGNANTQYSYFVRAYDAAFNISPPSNTVFRYTLSEPPGSNSITCDKPANTWLNTPDFKFTAVGGFGTGKVQYYNYVWNRNSNYSWGSEHESQWLSGDLNLTAGDNGTWYLHVKGFNAEDFENGTHTYGPFRYDETPPQMGEVIRASKYVNVASGRLAASWSATDSDSGIAEYQFAIGTNPENINNFVNWTSAGLSASMSISGLNLTLGQTYYFGVKALNGAGDWSDVAVSEGITTVQFVSTIADAKAMPDGSPIIVANKVFIGEFGDHYYICESLVNPLSGIRVDDNASFSAGTLVNSAGILQLITGERVISDAETTFRSAGSPPLPMFMINRSVGGVAFNSYTPGVTGGIGPNNIGMLITVTGRVTDIGSGYFVIDDGMELMIDNSMLNAKNPVIGNFVKVVGISSTKQSGQNILRLVKPRGDSDVTIYP